VKRPGFVDAGTFVFKEPTTEKTRPPCTPEFRRQMVQMVRVGRPPLAGLPRVSKVWYRRTEESALQPAASPRTSRLYGRGLAICELFEPTQKSRGCITRAFRRALSAGSLLLRSGSLCCAMTLQLFKARSSTFVCASWRWRIGMFPFFAGAVVALAPSAIVFGWMLWTRGIREDPDRPGARILPFAKAYPKPSARKARSA
jgi:hypothetical protein